MIHLTYPKRVGMFLVKLPFSGVFFCIFIDIIDLSEACIIFELYVAGDSCCSNNIMSVNIMLVGSNDGVGTMNTIIKRIFIYISIICFLTASWARLFVLQDVNINAQTSVIAIFIIVTLIILIRLLIIEVNNFKIAKLIKENFILKVKTAVVSEISGKKSQDKHLEDTDIFVSYFGILYNGRIAKFNQDGVHLAAMEIGNDFISFTYGNEKQMQNLRIVRPDIEPEAMSEMINKFFFETGITPKMVGGY